jgi:TPR repeat protein
MASEYNSDAAWAALDCGDYALAFRLAQPYADAGNASAQGMIGSLYMCGQGVPRDIMKAESWLIKAAKQNDALAWHNLGTLYALKLPELEHHWGDAHKCWEKAKELGFNLAEPYPPR